MSVPKSAGVRLANLLITANMINSAKINWKNFNEYFLLLKDFAQVHF